MSGAVANTAAGRRHPLRNCVAPAARQRVITLIEPGVVVWEAEPPEQGVRFPHNCQFLSFACLSLGIIDLAAAGRDVTKPKPSRQGTTVKLSSAGQFSFGQCHTGWCQQPARQHRYHFWRSSIVEGGRCSRRYQYRTKYNVRRAGERTSVRGRRMLTVGAWYRYQVQVHVPGTVVAGIPGTKYRYLVRYSKYRYLSTYVIIGTK
jgi:hypothetical protein